MLPNHIAVRFSDAELRALNLFERRRGERVAVEEVAFALWGEVRKEWPVWWRNAVCKRIRDLSLKCAAEGREGPVRISRQGTGNFAEYRLGQPKLAPPS